MYRWIFAIIFCFGWLASLLDLGRETSGLTYFKWPVYLTNWGYTVCTIQAVMAAYHVTHYYNVSKYSPGKSLEQVNSYETYINFTY